jgi:hypothetical protein
MGTELALPQGFGPVSSLFAGHAAANDELGHGIAASYGVMGYKGKVWTAKYQGVETQLMRDDGDGPRNSIEVVLIKASPAISKIFYASGYVEGSTAAPDCWSANGVTPDASVQNKRNATCADCPMNAWGSRISESGKQGKQCSDSRRVAIAPIADIDNEMFGGPMLLRIPAASLKDLKAYGDFMNSYQFNYYAVVTRISFDPKEAYPKFVFSAVRPLTDPEAQKVLALREDQRVAAVLSETQAAVTPSGNTPVSAVPASPFEQPVPAPAAPAATVAPAATPVAAPAPVPANPFGGPVAAPVAAPVAPAAPVAQPAPAVVVNAQPAAPVVVPEPQPAPMAAATAAPDEFDAMLDSILKG